MLYEAERGQVTLALCGDIMPSRRMAVFREPKFLALHETLNGADACFANLEAWWSVTARELLPYAPVRTW